MESPRKKEPNSASKQPLKVLISSSSSTDIDESAPTDFFRKAGLPDGYKNKSKLHFYKPFSSFNAKISSQKLFLFLYSSF